MGLHLLEKIHDDPFIHKKTKERAHEKKNISLASCLQKSTVF